MKKIQRFKIRLPPLKNGVAKNKALRILKPKKSHSHLFDVRDRYRKMSLSIEIRSATLNDLNALCDLESVTFDTQKYHTLSRRQFRHLLTKGNADILAAFQHNTLVGNAVIFYRKNAHTARLYSLAVHPNFQRQSIGHMLFDAAEQTIASKSLNSLVCECRSDEPALLNFYKKLNCISTGILPHYYADGMSGIKMKKQWE